MDSALFYYSGIAAKLHAKHGKLLTESQFRELAFLDTVHAAVEYLKSFPAYQAIFAGVGEEELHRGHIEQLLQISLYQDYSSLYRFASQKQRNFLDLYFIHFEVDILKKCLRNALSSRKSQLDLRAFENFFRRHSKLDLSALAEADSLPAFLENLRGTSFYLPLYRLKDQGVTALFDYETAMDTLYFVQIWNYLNHGLGDSDREAILECIGEKIDLLNLEWLLRAKKYYQLSEDAVQSFLIPVFYHLRRSQLLDMAKAPSFEALIRLLKTTRYGNRIFANLASDQEPPNVKELFHSLLNAVYRSSSQKRPYSAAALNSYFYFKEEELREIITAIEGIRYQLDGNEILACLAES